MKIRKLLPIMFSALLFTSCSNNVKTTDSVEESNSVYLYKMTETFENDSGVYQKESIVYDEQGRKVSERTDYNDGSYVLSEYTYNEEGFVTYIKTTSSDDDWCKIYYTYNESGNVTVKETKYPLNFWEKTEYTYDNNLLVKEVSTNSYEYTATTTYSYDEKGNLLEEAFDDSNDVHYKTVYKYIYSDEKF